MGQIGCGLSVKSLGAVFLAACGGIVYSVHSPKDPAVKKALQWVVPLGRPGKKLTFCICYSGIHFRGSRGWKYYFRWTLRVCLCPEMPKWERGRLQLARTRDIPP